MQHVTREEWLVAMTEALRPTFEDAGFTIPAVRVSCSWPSRQIRKRIGECWTSRASKDGSRQIFITPILDEGFAVVEVLVHELLHAVLPDDVHHKGPFRKGMKALGLIGKPTATNAGPELTERLHVLCLEVGDYPHSALSLKDPGVKKQNTRMLKVQCPACDYTVRTTAKWIEVGLPTCPCGEEMKLEEK
jgi:hypothetical protein